MLVAVGIVMTQDHAGAVATAILSELGRLRNG
jgi:hypothetical protein